jgi:hypothetical protein
VNTDFADGRWVAMTMGQFCQILIDSGPLEAIVFRVIQPDEPVDDGASFVRQYHVIQVPSGSIQAHINATDAAVHKVLAGFLERGLMS